MKSGTKWTIAGFVLVVLIAAAILSYTSIGQHFAGAEQTKQQQVDQTPRPEGGHLAPPFTLNELSTGQPVSLGALRGKPVLINFWASWCGPCKTEMPDLEKEYQQYKDRIAFYCINLTDQDNPISAKQFLQDHGITIPVLMDPTGAANQAYQIRSIPTTFAIGPNGVIVVKGLGMMTKPMMDDMIQKLLAAK